MKEKLSSEIVAFPQYGLKPAILRRFSKRSCCNGASRGGVDPTNVDGNMEKSLQQMMEIAVEGNADIDLYLYDPGKL